MSIISNWIEKIAIKQIGTKTAAWLDGKKTVLGAVQMLLWIAIYAIPAFTPNYNWLTVMATQIRDTLIANGIHMDNALFNSGVSFTVVGLVDKIRKMFSKE